jgi:hypothetical protein
VHGRGAKFRHLASGNGREAFLPVDLFGTVSFAQFAAPSKRKFARAFS